MYHFAHNWQFCIRACSSLPAHTIIWLSVIIWTTTVTHSVYSILIQHGYGAGIHRHCWLQVKDHLKKLVLKCYLKLCTVSRVGFLSCVCEHHYVQLLYTTDNPRNCPQRRNESQPQVTRIENFVKSEHVVIEIRPWTDQQTYRHKDYNQPKYAITKYT